MKTRSPSPTATATPTVSGSGDDRATLSCTNATWAGDYAGGYVWQAPAATSLSWLRDGAPVGGAPTSALTASQPGLYACVETGTNRAGSATVTSGVIQVRAAKLRVIAKTRKRKAKPGNAAIFKLQLVNQGDLAVRAPRLCAKVPKKARKYLEAPRCKRFGKLNGGRRRTAKLKVLVKRAAPPGTYKLKFVAKGAPAKPAFARLQVLP